MPHQCVRCGSFFDDGSKEIMSGCSCGGKLFFFVKKEKLREIQDVQYKLSKNEKRQIEKDVFDLIGISEQQDKPVILDFESIRILKPGKYELDLVNLFRDRPLVYKLDEGKYIIDLPETFKAENKRRKS
ncbi:MAG: Zn-ribbon containing protein [Nanoarchaeota archaeon]